MPTQGGPASNVVVQTGGRQAGGPALPVAVMTAGYPTEGDNAIYVYEAPAGAPVQAGPALPIVVAPAGSRVEGGLAIPVRVVSGSLGGGVPVNITLPTITGTLNVGQTLTGNHGTYTNNPTSFTYRWLRGGVAIGGATSQIYVTTMSDAGATITFEETPSNASGAGSPATSAGVTIFTPSSISGLTAWWRADSLALNDNDLISTLTDQSSSGFDFTAAGAARPTFKQTGGPNGKPAWLNDGASNSLSRANVPLLSLVSTNQCHIFIVQKQPASAANSRWDFNGASTPLLEAYLTFSDNNLYWDFGNNGTGRISVAQPAGWDDNWHIVQLIRESPNSGTSRIRVDGSEIKNGAVSAVASAVSATLQFPSPTTGAGLLYTETLIFNVALNTTDRQNMETYLNGKFAIF